MCIRDRFQLTEELSRNGATTARVLYNLPGWVAHHNTDLFALLKYCLLYTSRCV